MGGYLVLGKYKEFEQFALNDKLVNIDNKKAILKNSVDSFVQIADDIISKTESEMKDKIHNRVSVAYKIAHSIYEEMHPRHTDAEIKKTIKAALASMVYQSNYVFVLNYDGVIISSPLLTQIEGKNMMEQKDSQGNYTVKNSIEIVKKDGEGFMDVFWMKPGDDKETLKRKVVFVKKFEPFDWIIGYGEYQEDYQAEINEDLIKKLETIKYGNDGYLFATTYEGVSLSKPAKGKNMYNVRDVNGKYIVRDLIETAKAGGGYVLYVMPPFKGARPENKLSYVAPLKGYDWYIGTGMYLTDIEAAYQKRLDGLYSSAKREIILVVIGLLTLLVLAGAVVFAFSQKLQNLIDQYSEEINVKNEELSELNLSLEEKVTEKTAELNELNTSLEQRVEEEVAKNREKDRIMFQQGRLAAMGEMIGNIAHQWRQPLSSISLLVQDIQEAYECGELDDEYVISTVGKCTTTIGHMSDTIDNFRYFFNPDKERARFSVNEEIKKSLSLIDAGLENNNINIALNLLSEMDAYGVPGEYAQVIVNIVNNAKDALLSRDVASPSINISSKAEGGMVYVNICDNAGGVNDAIMDKIFEPYFTTKNTSNGTGIGLYFSKMIIEGNMGGKLTVQNSIEGACFTIAVPAAVE